MIISRLFIVCAIGFAGGIMVQSKVQFSLVAVLLVCASAIIFFVLAGSGKTRKPMALSLGLLSLSAGLFRMHSAVYPNQYEAILKRKTQFEAVIVADVDLRTDRQL